MTGPGAFSAESSRPVPGYEDCETAAAYKGLKYKMSGLQYNKVLPLLRRMFTLGVHALGMLAVLLVASVALASGPDQNRILNYQIRLTDANGIAVPDGTTDIKLTFYTAASGGTQLYTACSADGSPTGTPTAVEATFTSGVATVLIGDTGITCASGSAVAIPATLFTNTAMYLGVTVEADAEMTPRKRIVAAGYALNADRLDDLETSAVGGSGAFVPITDGSGNLTLTEDLAVDGTTFLVDSANNRIGIGTITPDAVLDIEGAEDTERIRLTDATNVDSVGIYTGSGTPNGSLTAQAGSIFLDQTGGVYVNTNDGTAWSLLSAGGSMAIGGTITSGTVGSLLFVGSGPSLAQDNANVFWDDASNRLGIGTNAPLRTLDVAGSQRLRGTGSTVLTGTIDPAASTTVTGVGTAFTTEIALGDRIVVGGETRTVVAIASDTSLTVDQAFSDNANDTSPDVLSAIATFLKSDGTLGPSVNDIGELVIGHLTSDPLGGKAHMYYNTTTNKFRCYENTTWKDCVVDTSGDITGTGSNGAVTFWSGSLTLSADSANFFWDDTNNRLGIGDATPAASLTVGSGDLFQVAGASGNITTAGTLTVNGTGASLIGGNLTVNGNTTLGNAVGDTVAFTGRLNSPTHGASKGLLLPTNAGAPSPVTGTTEGDIVWDTTNDLLYVYDGSAFTSFSAGGVSIGGDVSGGTVGSVLFVGTSGLLTQDNASFFWDDTNNRLGIGDATPAATLTVGSGDLFQVAGASGNITTAGTLTVNGTGASLIGGNLTVNGTTALGNASGDTVTVAGRLVTSNHAANQGFKIPTYGAGAPGAVTGTVEGDIVWDTTNDVLYIYDGADFTSFSAGGGVSIGGAVASGTVGSILFVGAGGNLDQDNPALYWDYTNDRLGLGDATPSYTLDINGTFRATGAALFDGTVALGNAAGDTVTVAGRLDLGAHAANIGLNIPTSAGVPSGVTGTAEGDIVWDATNNTLYLYDGASFAQINGAIGIGNTVSSGTSGSILYVNGSGQLAQENANLFWDDTNNRLGLNDTTPSYTLDINGTFRTTGAALFDGTVALGNAAGDTVTVAGRLDLGVHAANIGLNIPTNAGVPSGVTGTAEGDIVWDSTNDSLYIYDGAAFTAFTAGGDIAIGGDISGGTVGSILFVDTSGNLGQDNASFFWDDTNNRLGILDATPDATLDVAGSTHLGSSTSHRVTITGELLLGSLASDPTGVNGLMYYNTVSDKYRCFENSVWTNCDGSSGSSLAGTGATGQVTYWSDSNTITGENAFFYDATNDRLGIGGDVTPNATLSVGSTSQFQVDSSGAIAAATGVTSSGTITFSGLTASRVLFTNGSSQLATSGASAALSAALSDETGSGVVVFGTSPEITTSLTTASTTFALLNTAATTVNFAGAATALNLGASTGTTTIGNALSVNGTVLTLDADNAGAGADVRIIANQGSDNDGEIRYNATTNEWEFSNDGGTFSALGSGGAGANTALSNLASVAINTSLISDTDNTDDLGSDAIRWRDLYLGSNTLHIGTSTTDEGVISYNTTTNVFDFGTDSTTNGDIAFFTDDLYLDKSTGNVGIGDTTPAALLTVGSGDLFQVDSSGNLSTSGTIQTGRNGTDGQFTIYSEQGATDYSVVLNPHATMTQTTTYTLPANDGDASQVLTTDGAGALSWSAAGTGTVTGSGTATRVAFWSGSSALSSSAGLYWDSTNSRLGIGHSSPSAMLHINNGSGYAAIHLGNQNSTGFTITNETDNFNIWKGTFGSPSARPFQVTSAGNTLLNQNGGNVTVGSTTATSLFNVGSAAQLQVTSAGNLTTSGTITSTYSTGGNALVIDTTTLVADATNNRVGIGTASPAVALHVAGSDATTTYTSTSAIATIQNTSTTNNTGVKLSFTTVDTGASIIGAARVGTQITDHTAASVDGDLVFETVSASAMGERMRILSTGNVGIGDTSPAGLLTVGSGDVFQVGSDGNIDFIKGVDYEWPAADAAGVLTSDGSGNLSWSAAGSGDITAVGSMTSGAAFADSTADDDWLGLGASAGRIEFDDQTTDEVNILGANVGIGTSTPGANLVIHGEAGLNSALWMSDGDIVTPNYTSTGILPDPSNTTTFGVLANSSGTLGGVGLTGFTEAAANTTVPVAILGYHGGTAPTVGAVQVYGFKHDGATGRTALGATEEVFQVLNGTTVITTILGNGSMGINDETPDYLLDVAGTFGVDGNVTLGDASGDTVTSNAAAWTFANDTTVALTGGVNGLNFDSNTLSIDATNNRIGILTADPTAPLDISSGLIALVLGADSSNTTRTNAAAKVARIAAPHYTNAEEPMHIAQAFSDATVNSLAFGGGTSLMNAATHIRFYTAANNTTVTGTERMVIDTAGYVGIGETTPAALLTVGSGDLFQVNTSGNVSTSGTITSTYATGGNALVIDTTTLVVDATNNRVGIGTASPTYELDVQGNSNSAVRAWVRNTNSGTAAASLFFASNDAGVGTYIGTTSSGYTTSGNLSANLGYLQVAAGPMLIRTVTSGGSITLAPNDSVAMTLTTAGLVGIGTASPAGMLDVSAARSLTPSAAGAYLSISASTLTDSGTAVSGTNATAVFNSIAAPTLAATNATVTTTNAATFYVAGAPANGTNMTITNPWSVWVDAGNSRFDGSVLGIRGVNYTWPAADGAGVLTSDGSGNLSWSAAGSGDITAVGSMTSGAAFADSTADDDWLGLGASAGRIEFDDQTTDEVNILGANVGIGTATPGVKLHVQTGDAGVEPTWTAPDVAIFENASGTNASIQLFTSNAANGNICFSDTDTRCQGYISYAHATDSLVFQTAAAVRLTIDSSGRVGIGATTPDALLDIEAAEDTERIRLTDTTNADSVGIYTGTGSPNGALSGQAGSLFLDQSGTVYVNTNGTTGWTNLIAAGSGDITAVGSMTSGAAFADATADDDWLGLGASAGRIEFDDQATDEVNILGANVGIGTSTPSYALDIVSSVAAAGTSSRLAFTNTASDSASRLSVANDTGLVGGLNTYGSLFAVTGLRSKLALSSNYDLLLSADATTANAGTTYAIRLITGGYDPDTQTRMIVLPNGNIGIGDLTPAALLTVGNGDMFQVDSSGNVSNSGNTTFGNNSGDTVTSNAATWTFANDTAVALSGGVNGINFDSNTLSIDATNNRVGIGTAAPGSGLHVVDNALIGAATAHVTSDGIFAGIAALEVSSGVATSTDTGFADLRITTNQSGTANSIGRVVFANSNIGGSDKRIAQIGVATDGATNSGTLRFATMNAGTVANRMVILASGNVGIGDTTPAGLLTVGSGDVFQVGSDGNIDFIKGIDYEWPAADAAGILTSDGSGNLSWGSASGVTADSLDFIDFEDTLDLDAALTLNQTTNTWTQDFTGTTTTGLTYNANSLTTGKALQVNSSSLTSGSLVDIQVSGTAAASNTQTALNILTAGANATSTQTTYGAQISNTHTGTASTNVGLMVNASGGTNNYAAIFNGGNVGIGTSTPLVPLHVVTTGTDTGFQGNTLSTFRSLASGRAVSLQLSNNVDAAMYLSLIGAGGSSRLAIGGSSETLTILESGNVGIGDTSPDFLLDVAGTFGVDGNMTIGDASGDTVTSNAAAWTFANDTTVALSGGVNGLNFDSNTLSIDATNNRVGFGTSTPNAKLHVSAAGDAVSSALSTSDYIMLSSQSDAPGFSMVASSATAANRGVIKGVRSRGTLGSPTVPSNNDYVFTIGGAIYDGADTELTAAIDFYVDGTVSSNVAPQRISFVTGATNSASRTERMVIKNNGNIGIGVTDPDVRLEVQSNPGAAGDLFVKFTDSTATAGYLGFGEATGAGSQYMPLIHGHGSGTGASRTGIKFIGEPGEDSSDDMAFVFQGRNTSAGALTTADIFQIQNSAQDALFRVGPTGNLTIAGSTVAIPNNLNFDSNTLFIDASANEVGINTATPTAALDVAHGGLSLVLGADTNTTTRTNATDKYSRIAGAHYTNAEEPFGILTTESTASTNLLKFGGGSALTNAATEIQFYTAANNTTTIGTQRMTIDTSGNVGIGEASPGYPLDVQHDAATDTFVANFFNDGGDDGDDGIIIQACADSNPTSGCELISFLDGDGTAVGSVAGDGAGGISFNQTSDARLKENIVTYEGALAALRQIRVAQYNMKSAPGRTQIGFIAQELQEVFPQAVSIGGDDPEKRPWAVDYGRVTPLLVGAVQELTIRLDEPSVGIASSDMLEPGELVMIDTAQANSVKRALGSEAGDIAGHLLAGVVGARTFGTVGSYPVVYDGIVKARVVGTVAIGDPITMSLTAGVGVVATEPSYVVGYAMDTKADLGPGEVLVMVRTGWWNGSTQAALADDTAIVSDIMHLADTALLGGTWSIDADGRMTMSEIEAEKVTTKELVVKATDETQLIGEGVVELGNSKAFIHNPSVRENSRIFITFFGNVEGNWWISHRASGEFEITLSKLAPTDIRFEYFIVNVVDERTPPEPVLEPAAEETSEDPVSEELPDEELVAEEGAVTDEEPVVEALLEDGVVTEEEPVVMESEGSSQE